MNRSHRILLITGAAIYTVVSAEMASAQVCLPFAPGERLTYAVRAATMSARGEAHMTVAGPEEVRGHATLVLRSEASVGVGFIRGSDKTASWVDPVTLATLRFIQTERNVLSHATDSVEVFPDARLWERSNGRHGEMITDAPLDVLSFIYFLRTLSFGTDSSWTFNRHFDAARNPTTVRVIGHDTISTAAGRFSVWDVEMSVRDKEHYDGSGVIKFLFSDDTGRLPVRIQSVMPSAGTTVMTLSAVVRDPSATCPLFVSRHTSIATSTAPPGVTP